MMFYWLLVPGIAVAAALWLWRRTKERPKKILALVLIVPAFIWLAWTIYGGEKFLLDRQVQELCAKDGGIKVYETVKLPPDKFDQSGNVRIPSKQNATSSDEYFYQWDIDYLKKGNPELSRDHFKIIRRKDGKLLGELVSYGRGGGDLPGPWHDSSYHCPESGNQPGLEKRIFLRENSK
jgi:hypothetical protein